MNTVKDMLKVGKTAIGTTASLSSPVDFLADSGFDFILFDTQHDAVDIKELKNQVQAMRGKKAIPIIRVGANDQALVCYALDIGAKGIIVPMVNTKQEAISMVQWCKYPPEGQRSSAGMRGEWGKFENYRDYMDAVNRDVLIIPMIETVESLDNIDEILCPRNRRSLSGSFRSFNQPGYDSGLREPKVCRGTGQDRRSLQESGCDPWHVLHSGRTRSKHVR